MKALLMMAGMQNMDDNEKAKARAKKEGQRQMFVNAKEDEIPTDHESSDDIEDKPKWRALADDAIVELRT